MNDMIAFKAIELTRCYLLRTLGMNFTRQTPLRIGQWVENRENGFTAAKRLSGAREVIKIANGRKKKERPFRTAIAIIQGEQVMRQNGWSITFKRIKILDIIERSKVTR